jgi:hypothetical protein
VEWAASKHTPIVYVHILEYLRAEGTLVLLEGISCDAGAVRNKACPRVDVQTNVRPLGGTLGGAFARLGAAGQRVL